MLACDDPNAGFERPVGEDVAYGGLQRYLRRRDAPPAELLKLATAVGYPRTHAPGARRGHGR